MSNRRKGDVEFCMCVPLPGYRDPQCEECGLFVSLDAALEDHAADCGCEETAENCRVDADEAAWEAAQEAKYDAWKDSRFD